MMEKTLSAERRFVKETIAATIERQNQALADIRQQLDTLKAEGISCPFTAIQLWQLETVGLCYDFHAGTVKEIV